MSSNKKIQTRKNFRLATALVLTTFFSCWTVIAVHAQQTTDSVVQLYGVVMSADSLRPMTATSVIVQGKGRGTIANDQGIFSIVVEKGDNIRFSSIGYKDVTITIPRNLKGKEYSVIQLMVEDTIYLPATIIKVHPTPDEFARDFLNNPVPDDLYEVARQNNDAAKRRILMESLPMDGKEAFSALMRKQTAQAYYKGQMPPMNILNPLAWVDFIKAWKRGDFRRKDY
ncbi:MAG: carboxypeptidase-like regulatory domain-containing protein [Chitinophagaceae bacterium]